VEEPSPPGHGSIRRRRARPSGSHARNDV
jgi:hypothetical protein